MGVSILRAGETMEQALCEVYKDITIGKILIQTNFDTGEPEVRSLIETYLLRSFPYLHCEAAVCLYFILTSLT